LKCSDFLVLFTDCITKLTFKFLHHIVH
jgi:hypothetical protein